MNNYIEDSMIDNDDFDVGGYQHVSNEEQQNSPLLINHDDHVGQSVIDGSSNNSVVDTDDNSNIVNQGNSDPSFGRKLITVDIENDNVHQIPFGSKEEDNAWNEKQAAHAFEQETWHLDQARKAAERGDFLAAKDHRSAADSWHSTGKDYANKVKK